MAWLGSGSPSLVNDDLVRKFNERVSDDRCFTISDLSLHFPQTSRTLVYYIVSSGEHRRRPHCMREYKTLCPAMISASIIVENMWKNSLKNVESDNDKILYEILLNFSYSETVLTFLISLACSSFCLHLQINAFTRASLIIRHCTYSSELL